MSPSPHCHPARESSQTPVRALAHAPVDWLRPDWPAPAHVHALCTTRAGGCSAGGYASMNLGGHVGDDAQAVASNRGRLAEVLSGTTLGAPGVLGVPGTRPVFLNQVHGVRAAPLHAEVPDGTAADAALASAPGLACTVLVADCLPVFITDRQGRRVAAAHAGWRGLVGGVLESVLEYFQAQSQGRKAPPAMESEANAGPIAGTDLLAWLGPCIGPKAFEVGAEVRDAFCAADGQAAQHFAPQGHGKFLANLPALARQRLAAQGVVQVYGNDGSDAWCTFSQPSRFFSHRRDGTVAGGTGRMAACIWLG